MTNERVRRIFEQMVENEQVSIGRLYGRYGLALMAAENGTKESRERLRTIHGEIYRRTGGNMLLLLADRLYLKLSESGPAIH